MAGGMLKVLAVVLGLMVMAPSETMQLNVNHPLHGVVQRINQNVGPFLVLLISSGRDMNALINSGYFVPDPSVPSLTMAGRKLSFGFLKGAPVIVTNDGEPLAAVGGTVQMLLDSFQVVGVIALGGAGNVGDRVQIGDVIVPDRVSFAGVWKWQAYHDGLGKDKEVLPSLEFGDYNVPEAGENRLGGIQFQTVPSYTPTNSNKKTFWFDIDHHWVALASTIKNVDVNCVNEILCNPNVIHGSSVASSDIYVSNKAYGEYLKNSLDVAVVDTASAAVVQAAKANGVPHIVFRGVLDKPGERSEKEILDAVSRNVVEVVAKFAELIIPTPYLVTRATNY